MKPKWLMERIMTTLQEVANKDLPNGVIMQIKGKFGHAGRITENGRLYPLSVMKREIQNIQAKLQEKAVIGEADHPGPTQGGPTVRQSAFIITGLGMNDNGEIMGEADVVDTQAGKDLAALIRAGAQVGMSSRSKGTSKTNRMTSSHPDYERNQDWEGKEFEEVNDDLGLKSFDSVIGQAVTDAYIGDYNEDQQDEEEEMDWEKLKKLLAESEELRKNVTSFVFDSDEGKAKIAEAVEANSKELKEQFDKEVKEIVKEYMASDEFAEQFEIEEDVEGEDDNKQNFEEAKCAGCDAMIPKGSKYCPACGVQVVAPKKESTDDDKALKALEDRINKLESENKAKTEKIDKMEKDVEDRDNEVAVEAIVSEALEAKPHMLVEAVRSDLEGRELSTENAKELVEARIKFFTDFNEKTGGTLSKVSGDGKSLPTDPDDKTKNESKDKTLDVQILDQLD